MLSCIKKPKHFIKFYSLGDMRSLVQYFQRYIPISLSLVTEEKWEENLYSLLSPYYLIRNIVPYGSSYWLNGEVDEYDTTFFKSIPENHYINAHAGSCSSEELTQWLRSSAFYQFYLISFQPHSFVKYLYIHQTDSVPFGCGKYFRFETFSPCTGHLRGE
mgnify:CR=1 FL=1